MFYDVLLKLSQSVIRNHYDVTAKKKMRKNLSKLMALNNVRPDSDFFRSELDSQCRALKKSAYDLEISQISEKLVKEKNPRSEMVRELIDKNRKLTHKYNHIVDTNLKMIGEDYFQKKIAEGTDIPIEIYSTAHSHATKIIYRLFE